MINDEQSLTGATHSGSTLRVYDDGFGPLFVYGNEFGPTAVIRAQTWEDAYGIAEDEFMESATWADILDAYPDAGEDDCDYNESFGHRPNGPNGPEDEGIYSKSDYEWLKELTPELAERLEITLTITDPEPEPVEYCGGSAGVRFVLPGGRRFIQSYQGKHRNYHNARVFTLRRPRTIRHDRLGRWWDNDEADVCNPYGPRIVMNPADYSGITRWQA